MTAGTPDSRIAQILEIMELRRTARLESLADKLKVGTKTIKNDIRELNRLLEGSALVESVSGRYAFFVLDEKAFQEKKQAVYSQNDYMNSPAKRYGYILNRLMHEEEAVLIDDLADEICVGRTTINGDLKKLREMLEDTEPGGGGPLHKRDCMRPFSRGSKISKFQTAYGDYGATVARQQNQAVSRVPSS